MRGAPRVRVFPVPEQQIPVSHEGGWQEHVVANRALEREGSLFDIMNRLFTG